MGCGVLGIGIMKPGCKLCELGVPLNTRGDQKLRHAASKSRRNWDYRFVAKAMAQHKAEEWCKNRGLGKLHIKSLTPVILSAINEAYEAGKRDSAPRPSDGGQTKDYGYNCSVCGEAIKAKDPTSHTDRGLAHAECCFDSSDDEQECTAERLQGYDDISQAAADRLARDINASIAAERRHTFVAQQAALKEGIRSGEFERQLAAEREVRRPLVEALRKALLPMAVWKLTDESEQYKEIGPDLRKGFLEAHDAIMAALAKVEGKK